MVGVVGEDGKDLVAAQVSTWETELQILGFQIPSLRDQLRSFGQQLRRQR